MAYKQSNPIVRLVVLALVAWGVWKYGVPWLKSQGFGSSRSSAKVASSPSADCVSAVDDAVAVWSRDIVRFMNPPIDMNEWGDFRSSIDDRLHSAGSTCNCATEACGMATQASRDLRRLLSEMDAAVRSGGAPPGDLVQAQESIDLKLEEAWKLADAGK